MLSISKDLVIKIAKSLTFVLSIIFFSFLIFRLDSLNHKVEAVSETRYLRNSTSTVNGLSAFELGTSQTSTSTSTTHTSSTGNGNQNLVVYFGIRVWERSSSGVETEITSGSPVAQVSRSIDGSGIQSSIWTPPTIDLTNTDSLIVRVYIQTGTQGWNQGGTLSNFSTEQLGALSLQASQWTVYYFTERTSFSGTPASSRSSTGTFYWGSATHNSRIENFSYSSPITTIGTEGTQVSDIYANSNDTYIGGAFTFVRNESTGAITSIKLTQTGTVASSNLTDLRLYYKQESTCSSTIPVDATLFNTSPGTFSSGSSTVTGSMPISTSKTCLYVRLDIGSGASADETVEIEITNPSTDVITTGSSVEPATTIAINGTSTIVFQAIVAISIETDGTVDYGILPATESKSTIDLSDTQTIRNTGNVNIDLDIKSSNAIGGVDWTLGSNYGNDIFIHEYSNNSGSVWNKFLVADQYYALTSSALLPDETLNIDTKITVPSLTSDFVEKNITITILASESI